MEVCFGNSPNTMRYELIVYMSTLTDRKLGLRVGHDPTTSRLYAEGSNQLSYQRKDCQRSDSNAHDFWFEQKMSPFHHAGVKSVRRVLPPQSPLKRPDGLSIRCILFQARTGNWRPHGEFRSRCAIGEIARLILSDGAKMVEAERFQLPKVTYSKYVWCSKFPINPRLHK